MMPRLLGQAAVLLVCSACTSVRGPAPEPQVSAPRPSFCAADQRGSVDGAQWSFPDTLHLTSYEEVRRPPRTSAPGFAAGKDWFSTLEPIRFEGRPYGPMGHVYMAEAASSPDGGEVFVRLGAYDGVALYGRPTELPRPRQIYAAVAPPCYIRTYIDFEELRS